MSSHQNITVIGSKEFIGFPTLGLVDVPAKVDTGADSSAIWASDIVETDGELRYKLFDKTSRYYTGQTLVARKFQVVSIKNSFGQAEFRYKVLHRVTIAGRTIRVRFTLANRQHNSQPILIGRRTLHGKFLVDVASQTSPGRKRLLVLTTRISETVGAFIQGVVRAAPEIDITYVTYDDIRFEFKPQGMCITIASSNEDIADFDMIHFKVSILRDMTASMSRYARLRGIRVVDESSMHFAGTSKLYQYTALSEVEIAFPRSLFIMPHRLAGSYEDFKLSLRLPFVLKGIHASKGDHNYLIRNEADFRLAATAVVAKNIYVIGQAFVPNDGDYRILVMGRRISLVIHRSRGDADTHLNNTSQGGAATLVDTSEIPTAVQTDSLIAAKVLELGVAGIDMVQDLYTGTWYCFEVNDGPQIASGAFQEEKQQAFAKYILTELNK